eukprot:2875176-Prymnesium_polylepis.1
MEVRIARVGVEAHARLAEQVGRQRLSVRLDDAMARVRERRAAAEGPRLATCAQPLAFARDDVGHRAVAVRRVDHLLVVIVQRHNLPARAVLHSRGHAQLKPQRIAPPTIARVAHAYICADAARHRLRGRPEQSQPALAVERPSRVEHARMPQACSIEHRGHNVHGAHERRARQLLPGSDARRPLQQHRRAAYQRREHPIGKELQSQHTKRVDPHTSHDTTRHSETFAEARAPIRWWSASTMKSVFASSFSARNRPSIAPTASSSHSVCEASYSCQPQRPPVRCRTDWRDGSTSSACVN